MSKTFRTKPGVLVIPTLGRLMREGHKLEISLGYLKNIQRIINSLNDRQYPNTLHGGGGPIVTFYKIAAFFSRDVCFPWN